MCRDNWVGGGGGEGGGVEEGWGRREGYDGIGEGRENGREGWRGGKEGKWREREWIEEWRRKVRNGGEKETVISRRKEMLL